MSQSIYLKTAVEAVKRAEKIILDYAKEEMRAELKPDQSPVTIADQGAERIIIEVIKRQFPDHNFLGEEYGSTQTSSEFTWIIDPIDGTKNYLRKIPLFATQLALMRGNEFIVGVSNAPAMSELMYAEKGGGAYLNDNKVSVNSTQSIDKGFMSFGGLSYFKKKELITQLLSLVDATHEQRGYGDFWSYHLLAQGKIEIMVEAGTRLWDIAAVKVIVEEAGGTVTNMQGKPHDSSIGSNPTSIIASNGKFHSEILKFFS